MPSSSIAIASLLAFVFATVLVAGVGAAFIFRIGIHRTEDKAVALLLSAVGMSLSSINYVRYWLVSFGTAVPAFSFQSRHNSWRSFFLVMTLTLGLLPWPAENARADGIGPPSTYLPKPSSYLQARYSDPSSGEDQIALRRFKAMLDGGPEDKLHYHFQFIYKANNDSSTDDRIFLQDAYIVYPSGLSLKAGQFVPPFGLERSQPDWDLDFVDRTDVTNRLVVNGNLGDSFTRDRGLECDWDHGGWKASAGLFQGSGANNPARGNGPLGVARLSYGGEGSQQVRKWSWRAGLAGATRRDEDQNFSAQLPGLNKSLTSHFRGQDSRLNTFAQVSWGPFRAQGEYFRAWLEPASGSEIAATGAYGQVAYLPIERVIVGLRYEWFNPDVHKPTAPTLGQWTTAVTYDLPWLPLRLATDYSWADVGTGPSSVWRIQVQHFIFPHRNWTLSGKG